MANLLRRSSFALAAFTVLALARVQAGCSPFGASDGTPSSDASTTNSDASSGSDGGGTTDATSTCGADLTSDPLNCGACGKSCEGAACTAGVCAPVLIASQLPGKPVGIAVDDKEYFVVIDGVAVLRKAKDAAPSVSATPLVAAQKGAAYIAIAAGKVCWTSSLHVECAPSDGSASPTEYTPFNTATFRGIATTLDLMYLANTEQQEVLVVPYGKATQATLSGFATGIEGLALDAAENLYITTSSGVLNRRSVVSTKTVPETVAKGYNALAGVAVDETYVYVAEQPDAAGRGTIWRRRKDSKDVADRGEAFVSKQGTPTGLAVDAKYLYWTDAATSEVWRKLK
ncbi:hypothetical protein AKJ09_05814 [Labilithrix luteola]|uniref:Serine/threonine protein kinase n=1 Tax=Labilithrix luteola TaxID=1391654 RepID=A0A0K1Q039_9BACT|nr:hypothetical protein AKJ09_05814 [Labilithrix luteola]